MKNELDDFLCEQQSDEFEPDDSDEDMFWFWSEWEEKT